MDHPDDFHTWLNDHRIPPNERLIDFEYQAADITDLAYHKIETTTSGDTLILSFYAAQPVGCVIIGDVAILENLVILKFGQACNPLEDAAVTEVADLLFTYKIQHGASLIGLPIKIEESANLLK
jgi:hypothetical protein